MKRIYASAIVVLCFFYLSGHAQTADAQTFGKVFAPATPIPFTSVPEKLAGKDSILVQTTGTVKEVCQAKGCWMKVDVGNGQEMMVKFKDYAFFVPKDVAGKQVILNGMAYQKTVSVAQLQHYAEDAGKSEKEIAKINKPQRTLQFEADGIILSAK